MTRVVSAAESPHPGVRACHEEIAGVPVFWWAADPPYGDVTPLYVHGNPTDADDFLPFLARTGGIALDLPGFGRSGKSSGFDYSIPGYGQFLEAFVAHRELERLALVVHDWGAVGLALAQAEPERVARLVVMNAVPLLPGYRWHRAARIWRTRGLGELAMGATGQRVLRLALREAFAEFGPEARALADRAYSRFDHGTQRAALRLYRSAPPDVLARAGERLSEITCAALILWGAEDPYIASSFATAYGEALGGPAEVAVIDRAGHWPWLDQPHLVERVAAFLEQA